MYRTVKKIGVWVERMPEQPPRPRSKRRHASTTTADPKKKFRRLVDKCHDAIKANDDQALDNLQNELYAQPASARRFHGPEHDDENDADYNDETGSSATTEDTSVTLVSTDEEDEEEEEDEDDEEGGGGGRGGVFIGTVCNINNPLGDVDDR